MQQGSVGVLAQQLQPMVERGYSLIVGTVDDDGAPRATRAWGIKVVDEASLVVRFTMSADDPVAVGNLDGRLVAVTGADVRTLRAVQLKGRVRRVGEPDDDDLLRMSAHSERFFAAVEDIDGTPERLLKRILPRAVVAVDFVAEELFDQSPGPGAGAAVPAATATAR
jgi:hypothetical protein